MLRWPAYSLFDIELPLPGPRFATSGFRTEVLVAFHEAGWRIEDTGTYYPVECPCGDHQRSIHLTPSNPSYGRQALPWLRRQPCGGEGGV